VSGAARGPAAPRGSDAAPASRFHGPVRRDQGETPFSLILSALLDAIPLSIGAVLVDGLGESVDYAGSIAPFDLKVAAAHFQIVLQEIRLVGVFSSALQLTVRARHRSYVLRVLDREYSLLLVVHRHAAFAVSTRALDEAAVRLCTEAGIDGIGHEPPWYRVEVETGPSRRPLRLRPLAAYASMRAAKKPIAAPIYQLPQAAPDPAGWNRVDVIGTLTGTAKRERGYRIRLDTGAEMTLVRERHGLWFVDEQP
jgi:hypothetical protein